MKKEEPAGHSGNNKGNFGKTMKTENVAVALEKKTI
jgi:hypothetical protein